MVSARKREGPPRPDRASSTRDFGALPQFHDRGKAAHVELVEGCKFLRSQRRLNLIDDAVEPGEQFCLVFDPA
jgi:hypothetical protein